MEYSLKQEKDMVHPFLQIIWNVFQKEKIYLLNILDQITLLQVETSDDSDRYLKMGLRLDPNCADMNYRNEKDAHYPFIH